MNKECNYKESIMIKFGVSCLMLGMLLMFYSCSCSAKNIREAKTEICIYELLLSDGTKDTCKSKEHFPLYSTFWDCKSGYKYLLRTTVIYKETCTD